MQPRIPPAIALSLDEMARRKPGQIVKLVRDRGFRKDLRDQAHCSPDYYVDGSKPLPGDFNLYAAGGLSPFSASSKCSELACRVAHADAFARSSCLYAETVIAPDGFSKVLEKLQPADLLIEMAVLAQLEPLIRAGVIQFSPSVSGYCVSCLEAITGTFESVEDALWERVQGSFHFKLEDHGGRRRALSVGSSFYRADGKDVLFDLKVTRRDRQELPLERWVRGASAAPCVARHESELRERLRRYVSELMFDVGIGSSAGAVIGTNVKLGAAALRVIDGRSFSTPSVDEWEEQRSIQLPWIKNLSSGDILRVREDAASALPAFRQRLQSSMNGRSANDDEQARSIASELRNEAIELEEKLRIIVPAARRSRNLFAGLGLAVGLYGIGGGAASAIASGLAALSAGLIAAHKEEKELRHQLTDLKRQPSYVLVTAKRVHPSH